MADTLGGLHLGLIIFLLALLLIALSNQWAMRGLERYGQPAARPRVSILLPARNEADNIGPCLQSLLAQDYGDFEVLILDDGSTDGTDQIIHAQARRDSRVKYLKGQPLPAGWLGKHWACHQLAQAAAGELLLFTDADTRHHPAALRDAVSAMQAEHADLLTALPRQHMPTWGERLIVPLIPWSLFCFFPLAAAHRLALPWLAVAVGQFMLFRREAYNRIGGHASVRAHVADDIALARRAAAARLRWRLLDGGRRVSCRMYRNFGQAFDGFSKNLFAAFDYRVWPYAFVWAWLGIVFLVPLASLLLSPAPPPYPLAAIGLSLALWACVVARLGLPRSVALIYPAIIVMALIIALRSIWLNRTGRAVWKDRLIATRPHTPEA